MKIPVQAFRQENDGLLHFVEEGECYIYEPEFHKVSNGICKPYVSMNFGKNRLHINVEDFRRLCENFLYNTSGSGK